MPYDCIAAAVVVQEYITDHLMERGKWLKKEQEWSTTEKCTHATITQHIKALRALYDSQSAQYPEGPEAFKAKYGSKPNDGKELNGLERDQKKKVAATRQTLHKPRGKAALATSTSSPLGRPPQMGKMPL